MQNLTKVLERLSANNISLKLNKCVFVQKELEVLGHLINRDEVKVTNIRIQKLLEIKCPQNKRDIQSLLGALNYVSKFIPSISQRTVNIRKLLRVKNFQWSTIQDEELSNLKQAVKTIQPLAHPDINKKKIIAIECFDCTISCSLAQKRNNQLEFIEYRSRALTDPEQRYSNVEKEILAINYAINKFRHLLGIQPVIIETNCSQVKYIIERKTHSTRLTKLILDIQDISLEIVTTAEKETDLVDCEKTTSIIPVVTLTGRLKLMKMATNSRDMAFISARIIHGTLMVIV